MKNRLILIILLIILNAAYYRIRICSYESREYVEAPADLNVSSERDEKIMMYHKIFDFVKTYNRSVQLKQLMFSARPKLSFIASEDFIHIIEKYWKKTYYSITMDFEEKDVRYTIIF